MGAPRSTFAWVLVAAVHVTSVALLLPRAPPSSGPRRVSVAAPLRSVSEDLRTAHMASLARLASNLKNIRIEDIEEVFVTAVDGVHIDIQVMTCEDDGCVSVLVPITFPERCDEGADDFEECVVENVLRLDAGLVGRRAVESPGEGAAPARPARPAAMARFVTLGGAAAEEIRELPDWWRAADGLDGALRRACADAREILNDRFHDDVAKIARSAVDGPIGSAVVDELCPAGFLVVVGDYFEEAKKDVLPFRFERLATDVDSLHANVLGAVADAQRKAEAQGQGTPAPAAEEAEAAVDPWAPF